MNLNTTSMAINRCQVCDYPFADKHHIWPQAKGGKTLTTIYLCPNHHRFANLVQAMVMQTIPDEDIKLFAYMYFDPAFNATALDFLIQSQQELWDEGWSAYMDTMRQRTMLNPVEMSRAAQSFLVDRRARLDQTDPDEPVSVSDQLEALAYLAALLDLEA